MHTHCTYEYVEYDDEDILFKDDEALSRMAHGQLYYPLTYHNSK